jgi:alpha-D-ribose 1-methylphosphonate 5-triphosphate diphosphatase
MTDVSFVVRALLPDGAIRPCRISVAGDRIVAVDDVAEAEVTTELLALPGIVDLHGDAFERQLMPRPGVAFPPVPALIDTDRQLLSNGITTAYHGLTLSWEPGLRGAAAARDFLAALDQARPHLGCCTHLHLRFETANLEMVDEVLEWIAAGRVDLLAFNDHHDDIGRHVTARKLGTYIGRTGLDETAFVALCERVGAGRDAVPAAVDRLASAARGAGIPMVSHDDNRPADRLHYRALGSRICEFPMDRATAEAAIAGGDAVVLGAPNVVRGGSHARRLSAAAAAREGLCTILTSDYYYPALLQAPFMLAASGTVALARAWDLVARNPAAAAGLADRGAIAPGLRADLILVDNRDPGLPRVHATYVAGVLRFAAGPLPADFRTSD